MIAINLCFLKRSLLLRLVFSLLKAMCEGSRIECDKTDCSEGQRDQLGAGVRKTNAEIQSGSYCARFECADHIHRLVVHRGVDFFQNSVLGETTPTA